MAKPINVICCTYNRPELLRIALKSLEKQLFKDFTVLIVNDGGCDVDNILQDELRNTDYRYFNLSQNIGLAAAINYAIENSTSKYLMFIDDDNQYLPDHIATLYNHVSQHDSPIVYSDSVWRYVQNGQVINEDLWQWEYSPTLLNYQNYIDPVQVILDSEQLKDVGGFDKTLRVADWDMWLRLRCKGDFIHVPRVTCVYGLYAEVTRLSATMSGFKTDAEKMITNFLKSDQKLLHEAAAFFSLLIFGNHNSLDLIPTVSRDPNSLAQIMLEAEINLINGNKEKTIYFFEHALKLAKKQDPAFLETIFQKINHYNIIIPVPIALEKSDKTVHLGDLKRLNPISRVFGGDRMTDTSLPLCWFYIRRFLSDHVNSVAGRVLEIGDNIYTKMFGGDRVTQSDILHVTPDNFTATIIGDLTKADNIPSNTFDCVICTQTLHVIYNVKAALQSLYRILKPGGVLLASLPGISQISRYDMDRWGDYWRFTTASVQRLFGELWPENHLEIKSFGNVLTSVAYLHGLVSGEIPQDALEYNDNDYQMLICVCARKPLHPADNTTRTETDEITLISNGWDNYAETWAAETFKVLPGESVAYLGDEWTVEDVSGGGTTYGLDEAIVRNFKEYLVHQLLDPYLPQFAGAALEIGSGGGRITELLKTRTGLLHVADTSEAMLAKLKDRFALDCNLIYHFTDGKNLPFLGAESLDYVIAFDVFVHFEPRLVYWYLKQITELLKSGGTGIIHYANLTTSIGWQQFESDVEINVRRRTHFASFGTMCPEIMRMFLVSLDLKILSVDTGLIPRDAVAVFKKKSFSGK